MPLPEPTNALVIRYSYLWYREWQQGQEEGIKDRPCAVVLCMQNEDQDKIVTVLPITHTPPSISGAEFFIEIPVATKRRLNLDSERSWIVLTEANRFIWPGPDLRPSVSGDVSSVAYGLLPEAFFEQVRARFLALLKSGAAKQVARTN